MIKIRLLDDLFGCKSGDILLVPVGVLTGIDKSKYEFVEQKQKKRNPRRRKKKDGHS